MIHILTMGHLEPAAVGRRQAIVLRPLDIDIVNRLLQELGGRDEQGRPTLSAGTATASPRSSHCDSGRRRAACWPTGSIPASSSRGSFRG
jgi:hypothetical protein